MMFSVVYPHFYVAYLLMFGIPSLNPVIFKPLLKKSNKVGTTLKSKGIQVKIMFWKQCIDVGLV